MRCLSISHHPRTACGYSRFLSIFYIRHKLPKANSKLQLESGRGRYQVMEERIISSPTPEPKVLEDVTELMQNIQSRLPVKAAVRTSVLSKSWLHAWSTIPTLKFYLPKNQKTKQLKLVYFENTLIRYLRDNIPIERFDLKIRDHSQQHASLVENWIRCVASRTCLKELSLTINFYSFNLPEEILSRENLTKISLSELLDNILSSCRLLVKIELKRSSQDLKTIKVKSLPCLNELEIVTEGKGVPSVEISNVPNIRFFSCNLIDLRMHRALFNQAHSISLGSSVTELWLGGPGLVRDDASLDIIKSGFPFLESLTLSMRCWTLQSFHFTCASIKRFSLQNFGDRLINIQVNAPKLLSFRLHGYTMPSLSFPVSNTLKDITFDLCLSRNTCASFFLKMREGLELSLSSKYHVYIKSHIPFLPFDMDVLDDLKASLHFPPATNVETLMFVTSFDECLWEENSPFLDAFFEICHPKLVSAKLLLREVLERNTTTTMANWRHYLKNFQIRSRHSYAVFKLEWSNS
ncbi:unnamed protein product [Lactuca saligna]|uniref:FBD domain-containing protein n=1 Tax=Lactuca saligna TaxID=75948 RepID=A0AA35VI20_LACSI|nr:unnamed protein product [Lactuca saligna]